MSYVAGASSSIMKTISEIEAILDGEKLKPSGPKRRTLRVKLKAALVKSAQSWYQRGFKRGHMESFRSYKSDRKFPLTITAALERAFLRNTMERSVHLKSTLSKKFRENV